MASGFRFFNFKVYQDSKKFYHLVVELSSEFDRRYASLADQMRRSALSIVLNIAEGSAKKSDKDFNRYLKNSLGSVNETVAALDVACEAKLIARSTYHELIIQAEAIANQLGGFSKKLK